MHPLDNEALKQGAKAVRRRRLDAENRQDFISLLGRIVVILLCAWVLFTQVFLLTQAKGSSMFPAVKDGDLLICYRLQKTYAKNDVVVYTQGGKLRVGRILGREGDLVALDDSGTLVVNGAVQSGEILYPTYAKDALEYPYTVPEGCFFVLGGLPHTIRGQPGLWPGSAGGCASKSNYTTAATQFVIPRRPEEAAGILPVNRGVWAAAQEYELFLTREE